MPSTFSTLFGYCFLAITVGFLSAVLAVYVGTVSFGFVPRNAALRRIIRPIFILECFIRIGTFKSFAYKLTKHIICFTFVNRRISFTHLYPLASFICPELETVAIELSP